MSTLPKLKAEDLARERQAFQDRLRETLTFDELSAKRLERQLIAERDRPGTPPLMVALMWHELAYLSAFAGRTDQALSRLDQAEGSGFSGLGMDISRAFVMELGGRFTDARSVIEALDVAKIDASARKYLVPHYVELGMFKAATEAVADISEYDDYAEVAKSILEDHGIDDADVTARLQFAAAMIIDAAKHPLVDYKLFAMRGEGILYQFVVKGSTDELVELSIAISDALTDHFDGPLSEILSIDIVPFVPGNGSRQVEVFHVGFQ